MIRKVIGYRLQVIVQKALVFSFVIFAFLLAITSYQSSIAYASHLGPDDIFSGGDCTNENVATACPSTHQWCYSGACRVTQCPYPNKSGGLTCSANSECGSNWCNAGCCTVAKDTGGSPVCQTTTICGQTAAGNSPSDCTARCGGGGHSSTTATYYCEQSNNSACNGFIACASENSRCATPPADVPTGGSPACKTTTICGQTAAGNSPSDCTARCGGGGHSSTTATYYCEQSNNSACNGFIACASENSRCGDPSTTVDDRSTCNYRFLETATRQKAAYLMSQKEYILEVTMKNTSPTSTWKPANYKMAFEKNKGDWNGSDQPLTEEIAPNESEVFDIRVKAPATTNNEARKAEFFIRMQRDGVGFGAACEPDSVEITPTPPATTAPAGPVSTQCYVISEDLAEVNQVKKCDVNDSIVRFYTQHPVNLNYKFKDTTPGLKNLYVKFLDNNNNPSNEGIPYTKTILLAPTPSISSIDCKYIQNELGTSVTVNGLNLGTQGKGSIKVGNQQALVSSWNNTAITSSLEQRLESSARVTVTFDDGKTLSDTCAVNTTTFTFTAKNQCVKDANFSAQNVDVKIYETGEEPIFRQQIRLDKDGKPQSFTPKLEKDKKYTMVIKAPGTIARKVEVKTGSGGTNIVEPFVLGVGDIHPKNDPNGKVDIFDVSELKRQWSPTKDTQATGDLNHDGRVNNVDWSCMRININKEDESFSPPAIPQTVKIGNKGKVYMDSNDNNVQDTNEQVIAGVVVKLLKVPDTHVVGQRITPAELVNSQSLAQVTTASDGSFEISANRNTPVTGNFAFVVDASSTTGSGGEMDWKIITAINADSIQSWNIPVKP